MSTENRKYFLDQDNSSHWYIVPLEMMSEWNEWLDLDEDDPASWEPPKGCEMIGGHPSGVVFENWCIG
jgi:hypothetical protein